MDTATLAGREHENMLHAFGSTAANVPGSLVTHEGGVLLVATGLPIRLFNQVIVEDDTATPESIAGAVGTLRDRDTRFVVHLRRGADDRFVPVVERLGLEVPDNHPAMPGMAMPLATSGPRATRGLEIRRVADTAGQDDHILTAAAGFDLPEEFIRPWIGTEMWKRPGVAMYVGYADDEPVTTGIGIRTGPTIGIYNIATSPTARGRGFGTAITHRIAVDGAADGCDVAILQSSEMGRPIYERLGFRTVCEYDGWIDPVAAVEPDPAP